jgi:hypothetical protein
MQFLTWSVEAGGWAQHRDYHSAHLLGYVRWIHPASTFITGLKLHLLKHIVAKTFEDAMKTCQVKWSYSFKHSYSLYLIEMSGYLHAPVTSSSNTKWVRDCTGSKAGLDGSEWKYFCTCRKSNSSLPSYNQSPNWLNCSAPFDTQLYTQWIPHLTWNAN